VPLCGHFVYSQGYYRIYYFIAVFGELEALFPRENEQNIGMMEYCKIIDKTCPHASKSNYDPMIDGSGKLEKTFCGMMTGHDCRVDELKMCWLGMTNSQRSVHRKKMKVRYESYKLSRG